MSPTTDPTHSQFEEAVKFAQTLKKDHVDRQIHWYTNHTSTPRLLFRIVGIFTILLSSAIPAVAAAKFQYKDAALSVMSVLIAIFTGLGSFFRWEKTWRGNSNAQMALEQLVAKWELELANARLILPADKRIQHVYQATDELLANSRGVVSSESEGFFNALQLPQQSTSSKVT